MVVLLSQDPHEKVGYTNAVDWWSLGATIYKLLTNDKPFADYSVRKLMEIAPLYRGDMKFISKYAILFQELPRHPNVDAVSTDVIRKLLNVDEEQRLGVGKAGLKALKAHEFFKGIDWDMLDCKQIPPPYIPDVKPLPTTPNFESFADMMCALGKFIY